MSNYTYIAQALAIPSIASLNLTSEQLSQPVKIAFRKSSGTLDKSEFSVKSRLEIIFQSENMFFEQNFKNFENLKSKISNWAVCEKVDAEDAEICEIEEELGL